MRWTHWAGKLKVWQQRLATYISMVNFAMLFYLYIIESPMGLRWYHWFVIITVGVLIIVYIDARFIFPSSLAYTFEKNPEFTSLRKASNENSEKLDFIIEALGLKRDKQF